MRLLGGALACLLLLATLVCCGRNDQPLARVNATPGSDLAGFVHIPGKPLGPAKLTVTSMDGTPWRFDQAASGKITLIYFGYTSCPDVCPTTMADLANALRRTPRKVRDKIEVRFVSTDPRRDTPTQIRSWLSAFDPTFIGSRGPIRDVISAARTYGIGIDPPHVTNGDYQVTHGAQLLVLQPGGGEVGYFRELAGAGDYAASMTVLVRRYAHPTSPENRES